MFTTTRIEAINPAQQMIARARSLLLNQSSVGAYQ